MRSKSLIINPAEGLPQINLPHREYPAVALESSKMYDLQTFEYANLANIDSLHHSQPSLLKRMANSKSSDHDLVSIVTLTLLEVITSIGLQDVLHVEKGSFFVDDAWNVLVIRRTSGEEVAVFAVTPFDEVVLSSQSSVQAQVLDYMVKIASYEGQRDVFGGVTSYEQWRFCCLPGTEEVANADVLLESLDPLPDELHVAQLRRLMCSQSYARTSPQLLYALESLLLRAQASPALPRPSLLTHTHLYIDLAADRWQWITVTPEAPMSLLYPASASVWYTLLLPLRHHRGSVWLARADCGAVVVLKVPLRRSWSEAVVEAGVWLHVWGVAVRTVKVMNVTALELPFVYEACVEDVDVECEGKCQGEVDGGDRGVEESEGAQGGGAEDGAEGGVEQDGDAEDKSGEQDIVGEKAFGSGRSARKRRHRIRHKHRLRLAKAAALTNSNTNNANTTTNASTRRRSVYFTGITTPTDTASNTASTTSNTTFTTTDAELQYIHDELQRLAADPLGTARRALAVLVNKGLVLCDEDVRWTNLAVLPQRRGTAQVTEGEGCESCELVLTPIITALSRLQPLLGDAEQEMNRMVALLEEQLGVNEK